MIEDISTTLVALFLNFPQMQPYNQIAVYISNSMFLLQYVCIHEWYIALFYTSSEF